MTMSDSIPYADIIILALVAIFILLRLPSVLGDRTSGDIPSYFSKILPSSEPKDPVVQLEDRGFKVKTKEENDPYVATLSDSTMIATIGRIKALDTQFTATRFLEGAK